jgi:hypothetical protein
MGNEAEMDNLMGVGGVDVTGSGGQCCFCGADYIR